MRMPTPPLHNFHCFAVAMAFSLWCSRRELTCRSSINNQCAFVRPPCRKDLCLRGLLIKPRRPFDFRQTRDGKAHPDPGQSPNPKEKGNSHKGYTPDKQKIELHLVFSLMISKVSLIIRTIGFLSSKM